jgi:hypothetical protein
VCLSIYVCIKHYTNTHFYLLQCSIINFYNVISLKIALNFEVRFQINLNMRERERVKGFRIFPKGNQKDNFE